MKFNKILALSCLLISGANSSTDYIQSPGFDEAELNIIPRPDFSNMEERELIYVEKVFSNISNFHEDEDMTPNPEGISPKIFLYYENSNGETEIVETIGAPYIYNRLPESSDDSFVFFTIAGVNEFFQN